MGDGADDALDRMMDQDELECRYGNDLDTAMDAGAEESLFDYDGAAFPRVFRGLHNARNPQPTGPTSCPYCGAKVECKDSAEIYHGHSYGYAYICTRYPECDAYVGCHKGTRNALGTMANAALRDLRKQCHAAFDPMWQRTGTKRTAAYEWLAKQLGIPVKSCHIAMMDEATCQRVLKIVKEEP